MAHRKHSIWETAEFAGSYPRSCDEEAAFHMTDVELCHGPTRFRDGNALAGGISDSVAGLLKAAHVWIKTPDLEVGMGPQEWKEADHLSSPLQKLQDLMTLSNLRKEVQVSWVDHHGFSEAEGAKCTRLSFCDEACIEQELQIGKRLGVYSLFNQCHSATVKVLRDCGCYNHCVGELGTTGFCKQRIFPILRGLN